MQLTDKIFTDSEAAREHLEAVRWPNGAYCPHCGSVEVRKLAGKSARPGTYQCNGCREQFTVTVKTVFEKSKIPLNKWLMAAFLLASSKKGVSAHQIHRTLGVTYKTAWFMMHRLREAATEANPEPMGGEGKTLEADETFLGNITNWGQRGRGISYKMKVMTLVERGGGARSFVMGPLTVTAVGSVLEKHADPASHLRTDEAAVYKTLGWNFASHATVNHSKNEYVSRTDKTVHSNTVESYYNVFKRGMKGVYQHCGQQHLHRYLAEFDFRYSNRSALGVGDTERTNNLLAGAEGKRLTYRRSHLRASA